MEAHAARSLHQGLDNDTGDLVRMPVEKAQEIRGRCLAGWQVDHMMRWQQWPKELVHSSFGVADRHRAGRVAVIGAPKRQELAAPRYTPIDPELDRHLHGDL